MTGNYRDREELKRLSTLIAKWIGEGAAYPLRRPVAGQTATSTLLQKHLGLGSRRAAVDVIHRIITEGLDDCWPAPPDHSQTDIEPATIEERQREHRAVEEAKRLRAENRQLLEQLNKAEDLRDALGGLSDPLEPVSFQPASGKASRQGETVILFLSDLHWGERIDLGVMDGLNSYDTNIARRRLKKVFQVAIDLMTEHWPSSGPAPERIILVLGGDLITGEIHEELAKTNTLMSIPALKDCAAHISAGIRLLHDAIGCPIDIISVPGNHGRTTRKPESKLYAEHSYDTLCADLVEMDFREAGGWPDWFRMFKPQSGDALIWIYGYRFLITHGDRIGSRGGQGFVGPAATIARGFKKLMMDYAARAIVLDYILCGHFHVSLKLEEGFCNGSLPGPSEYGRDARFRPAPCSQWFLSVHPAHGVTQAREIKPGSPDEGTIYEPKQAPADGGKPRFRIPAAGHAT